MSGTTGAGPGSSVEISPRSGRANNQSLEFGVAPEITELSNKGLHQTGRGGAVASRPVIEARPAGEARCWTDAGR